jgi:hypothetical protein
MTRSPAGARPPRAVSDTRRNTRSGSGISSHPYGKAGDGALGTDTPSEATGREELETMLSPRRAGRRARRGPS